MNLERWSKVVAPGGMYVGPSERGVYQGTVYGHPFVRDGTVITTNEILGWDFRDACFVDSTSYEYRLRNPDETYEQRFPNAKAKVEKAIKDRKFMMSTAEYLKRYKEGNIAA